MEFGYAEASEVNENIAAVKVNAYLRGSSGNLSVGLILEYFDSNLQIHEVGRIHVQTGIDGMFHAYIFADADLKLRILNKRESAFVRYERENTAEVYGRVGFAGLRSLVTHGADKFHKQSHIHNIGKAVGVFGKQAARTGYRLAGRGSHFNVLDAQFDIHVTVELHIERNSPVGGIYAESAFYRGHFHTLFEVGVICEQQVEYRRNNLIVKSYGNRAVAELQIAEYTVNDAEYVLGQQAVIGLCRGPRDILSRSSADGAAEERTYVEV